MKWTALILILLSRIWIESVLGDAFLSLKFINFRNPGGKGSNGHCCDGRLFFCPSPCDHSFDICIDARNGPDRMDHCRYGRKYSGEISDTNNINFGAKIGRLDNPVVFGLSSWPAFILIKINIHDVDDNGDDHVDYLKRPLYAVPTTASQTTVILLRNRVSLTIAYAVYCGKNYYGLNCSVLCDPGSDPSGGHYSCEWRTGVKLCHVGWTGRNCDVNIDDCAPVQCLNGGTCKDGINSYTCQCASGYTGRLCDFDIDECLTQRPCKYGKCHNTHGGFYCNCQKGYTDATCSTEIDECASSPCQNNGVCRDQVADFNCACPVAFSGKTCSDDVDECLSNPCINGGTCVNTIGSFSCSCPPGFSGKLCDVDIVECESDPCQNGGMCTDGIASYTCECSDGYRGMNCETNIDECEEQPGLCQNGASCIDTPGNYSCYCTEHWEGKWCEVNVNECLSVLCLHNGTCTDVAEGFLCECPPTFTGQYCEEDVDECANYTSPCLNQANCSNTFGGFQCACDEGWKGDLCEVDVNECALETHEQCWNRSDCLNSTEKRCLHDNDCANATLAGCDDDGKCSNITLKDCDTEQNCIKNILEGGCSNETVCGNMTLKGCIEVQVCQNVTPEMCANGGECFNTPGSYRCSCPFGWTGPTCEVDVDECSDSIQACFNGARCTNLPGSFSCECSEGWTGQYCDVDIDECEADPDLCNPERNMLEISAGGSSFANKSRTVCINTKPGYVCACREGWTGPKCDVDIDECSITVDGHLGTPNFTTVSLDKRTKSAVSIPFYLSCTLSQQEVNSWLKTLLTKLETLLGKHVVVDSKVTHVVTDTGIALTLIQPIICVDGQQMTSDEITAMLDKARDLDDQNCPLYEGQVEAKIGSARASADESDSSNTDAWFPAVPVTLGLLFIVVVVIVVVLYHKKRGCWDAKYRVKSQQQGNTTFHNNVYNDSVYTMSQLESPDSNLDNMDGGPSTASLQPISSTTMSSNMGGQYQNEDNLCLSIANPLYQSMDEEDFVKKTRKESVESPKPVVEEGQNGGTPTCKKDEVEYDRPRFKN